MAEEAALRSRETAEAVARRSYGKLVALLAARMRDVAGAEDALSDAFAASLTDWPRKGIPAHSEAWLLTVARRKMLDSVRRRRTAEEASADLRLLTELAVTDEPPIPDDRLGLMFACAHPRLRRRDHRLGFPDLAGDDGPAAGAGEDQDQAGRYSLSCARGQ
jgi:RNA polymerase sigma-70 factor (ECF subfamily)